MPVRQSLVEVRRLLSLVHVDLPKPLHRYAQPIRDLTHIALGNKQPLRSTEPTKGSIGHRIRLANPAPHMDIRDLVAVITVRHGALAHRSRQVPRPAAVVEDVEVERLDLAVPVDANLPPAEEGMALARRDHVLLAREHAAHGLARLLGSERDDGRQLDAACLFAAEAAAEALDFHDYFVVGDAESAGGVGLAVDGFISMP